jgi:hypothetical protein
MLSLNTQLEIKDSAKERIATFHERRFGIFSGRPQRPYLEIADRGMHFVDQIVLTFMYMEKLRKEQELVTI